MKNNSVSYHIDIYNAYVDFPIAMADINDFSFDDLINSENPLIREFSCIIIKKYIINDNCTTVKPLLAIYQKDKWKFKYYKVKSGFITLGHCTPRCIEYQGILKLISCRNQNSMIMWYDMISKIIKNLNIISEEKSISLKKVKK